MLQGCNIVCISSLDWDAHWTSKQQIMHRLAVSNRVLYVEEPVTMLAPFKVPSHWRRWGAVYPRLKRAESNVWTLRPPPVLPFGNMRPAVNRSNQRVMAQYISWATRVLGMRDYLLWAYLPTAVELIDRLRPEAVIYHCVDEHSAFPGFVNPDVVRSYDDRLTGRSDLVITTAENLRAARKSLNDYTFHVPNAADVDLFETSLSPELPLPADAEAIPPPRIGVIGVHDERLDESAIEAIALADEHWQVLLIGPVRPGDVDEERLRRLPNVHFLGNKRYEQLPAYLKALDVALIPYKLNELSRNIFPLKLFEYLAGGVPVVSAALPELIPYREIISLAESPEAYPALVRLVLEENGPERREARVALARENSWDHRVEAISVLVERMLERKKSAAEGGGAAAEGGARA